eukprot:4553816-Pyramimonas_sp.AAC.1
MAALAAQWSQVPPPPLRRSKKNRFRGIRAVDSVSTRTRPPPYLSGWDISSDKPPAPPGGCEYAPAPRAECAGAPRGRQRARRWRAQSRQVRAALDILTVHLDI